MTKIEHINQSDSRDGFLTGLEAVLQQMRDDPVHGKFLQRYLEIEAIVRKEKEGSLVGTDPLLAVRKELDKRGTWTPVQDLALELNKKDVLAPATRNVHSKTLKRRALSNVERLIRIVMQGVNHGRLAGFKRNETGVLVSYIGLIDDARFKLPPNVTVWEAKKNRPRKKSDRR